MAKQIITLELEEGTVRGLALLGPPVEVLEQLATAAAEGRRRPAHPRRDQTDQSIKAERKSSDDTETGLHTVAEEIADEVVRSSRARADQILKTARDNVDHQRSLGESAGIGATDRRAREDTRLEGERFNADAALEGERQQRRALRAGVLGVERSAADKVLTGERSEADSILVDLREANEQMVGATLRAHDLTEEAQLARSHAEQSERELRKVAEFRELFIGILGHDLRNPVSAISMAAGLLLRRGHLGAQDAETAARIIRSSQRMSRMITQLLDLTRARLGGGMPIAPKPTDLRDVCRNVVEEFEAAIELTVEGEVAGSWDQDRLEEVLSNLVGNAIEHAEPDSVVRVHAAEEQEEVVVRVSNQGDTIPPELLPFIFEPFRGAKKKQPSQTENLGLGLYIAQQIVRAHGGKLEASSADGRTEFVIRLPRASVPA